MKSHNDKLGEIKKPSHLGVKYSPEVYSLFENSPNIRVNRDLQHNKMTTKHKISD